MMNFGQAIENMKLIPNFEFVGMAWEPVALTRSGAF